MSVDHISTLVRLDIGTLTACLRRTQTKHVADLLLGPRSHGPDDEETYVSWPFMYDSNIWASAQEFLSSYDDTESRDAEGQALGHKLLQYNV